MRKTFGILIAALALFGCTRTPLTVHVNAPVASATDTQTKTQTPPATSVRTKTDTDTSTATTPITVTTTEPAVLDIAFATAFHANASFNVKPGQKNVIFGTLMFTNMSKGTLKVKNTQVGFIFSKSPRSNDPYAEGTTNASLVSDHITACKLRSWPEIQVYAGPVDPNNIARANMRDEFEVQPFNGTNALPLDVICDMTDLEVSAEVGFAIEIMDAEDVHAYDLSGNRAKITRSAMNGSPPKVAAILQPSSGCEVVGSANFSFDGKGLPTKVAPITSAASDKGTAVAVLNDGVLPGITVNLYGLHGEYLSAAGLAAEGNVYPSVVKMVGGKDDYVIAIADVPASESNGWLADYSIYHIGVGFAQVITQVKGVKSLALVSASADEFYSLELMPNQGTTTIPCDGKTKSADVSSVLVRPLLSGNKPQWTTSGQYDSIVDAAMVGGQLKMLIMGSILDCVKSYSLAQIVGANAPWTPSILKAAPESVQAYSLLASANTTAVFWADQTDTGGGSFTKSFHITKWADGNTASGMSEIPGQPTYVTDRPAVMGWDDNIVQVAEGWDTDPSQVLLYVGKGDATWMSHKIYRHEAGQYVKSFAGKDKHFVIVDGQDLVHGGNSAWATFVTCK